VYKKVGELEAKNETVPSHVIPPTQEELLHYGKHRPAEEEMDDEKRDRERVQTWVTEHLAPCVRGAKGWKGTCTTVRLSETDFTPSDEAFAILASINMWDKWDKRDGILDDPEQDDGLDEETRRKKKRAEKGLYTGGGSNRKFCGWSSEGLVKYNELIAYVMSRRKADWTPVVEDSIKDALRARHYKSVSCEEIRRERVRKRKHGAVDADAALPKVTVNVEEVAIVRV
jgi:hypothetical protein